MAGLARAIVGGNRGGGEDDGRENAVTLGGPNAIWEKEPVRPSTRLTRINLLFPINWAKVS